MVFANYCGGTGGGSATYSHLIVNVTVLLALILFITQSMAEPDRGWRWCFICVSSGPDTGCERDPASLKTLNHINCTRPYCTVKRVEHGGAVWSFERACHVVDFGNECQSALGGNQRVCHTTCTRNWCNSGPGLPSATRHDADNVRRRGRNGGVTRRGSVTLMIMGALLSLTRILSL